MFELQTVEHSKTQASFQVKPGRSYHRGAIGSVPSSVSEHDVNKCRMNIWSRHLGEKPVNMCISAWKWKGNGFHELWCSLHMHLSLPRFLYCESRHRSRRGGQGRYVAQQVSSLCSNLLLLALWVLVNHFAMKMKWSVWKLKRRLTWRIWLCDFKGKYEHPFWHYYMHFTQIMQLSLSIIKFLVNMHVKSPCLSEKQPQRKYPAPVHILFSYCLDYCNVVYLYGQR